MLTRRATLKTLTLATLGAVAGLPARAHSPRVLGLDPTIGTESFTHWYLFDQHGVPIAHGTIPFRTTPPTLRP